MNPNKVTAVLVRSSQNQTPGSILIYMDLAMNPAGRMKATTLLEMDSIGSGTLPGPNHARHDRKEENFISNIMADMRMPYEHPHQGHK